MPSSYPARTILQLRFPSESKERDMQQAITFAPETPKDFCYYAPQIWSLILDKSKFLIYRFAASISPLIQRYYRITRHLCID